MDHIPVNAVILWTLVLICIAPEQRTYIGPAIFFVFMEIMVWSAYDQGTFNNFYTMIVNFAFTPFKLALFVVLWELRVIISTLFFMHHAILMLLSITLDFDPSTLQTMKLNASSA